MIRTIYGPPCDVWADVMVAQHAPFIWIQSNGSRWAGERPGDIPELLAALNEHTLDPRLEKYGFRTVDPCRGVQGERRGEWVNGPRLFDADGVHYFFGNFYGVSHVFGVYTNHAETIAALSEAIARNLASAGYARAREEVQPRPTTANCA